MQVESCVIFGCMPTKHSKHQSLRERLECLQDNGVGLKDREPDIVQQEERLKTQA